MQRQKQEDKISRLKQNLAEDYEKRIKQEQEEVRIAAAQQAERELEAWIEVYDPAGMYYYNEITGEVSGRSH